MSTLQAKKKKKKSGVARHFSIGHRVSNGIATTNPNLSVFNYCDLFIMHNDLLRDATTASHQ